VQARAHKLLKAPDAAVKDLNEALAISKELDEYSGDVDTLGALADLYVDLDDLERASKLYDQIITAIQIEDTTTPLSSSWDC
jgi:tetratricopeptide (TPR) repeat protein